MLSAKRRDPTYYEWHYEVAANTAEADKIQVVVEPGGEILRKVEVFMPPGCSELARCQVFQGGFQVLPGNPGGYVATDSERVVADLHYDMAQNKGPWYWYVWNLDDTYAHGLTLAMTTFERTQLLLSLDPASWLTVFKRLFGRFRGG